MGSWRFNQEQISEVVNVLVDNDSELGSEFKSIYECMKGCDQEYVYVIGRPEC